VRSDLVKLIAGRRDTSDSSSCVASQFNVPTLVAVTVSSMGMPAFSGCSTPSRSFPRRQQRRILDVLEALLAQAGEGSAPGRAA
jgi:hypothetical protein